MRKRLLSLVTVAAFTSGLAQSAEQDMARTIEQFMQNYDPNRTYGPPSGGSGYTQGADMLSMFVQAYNLARQFFKALPPIYLRDTQNVDVIRNRILDRGTTEVIVVSGKQGKLPPRVLAALEERVFIPDRTYPNLKLSWAMTKEELPQYKAWERRPNLRAELTLSARGEDIAMEVLGVTESVGFGFLMVETDLYLFTSGGVFFLVDPGPAGSFIPWIRLAATQIGDAKRREP